MIEVRNARREDWADISRLLIENELPFPNLANLLSIVVVVKDGKVIAFGYIKTLVEAVFVPDKSSKKNIVSSLRLVCRELIEDAQEMRVEQIHLFASNPSFADIMRNHYSFDDIVGEGLVLEVPNG